MKMRPHERQEWILDYVKDNGGVDTMNCEFEEAYIRATGASHRQIPTDLRQLFDHGRIRRSAVASGMPYAGAARWVRSYFL